jgi:hypothetical protein
LLSKVVVVVVLPHVGTFQVLGPLVRHKKTEVRRGRRENIKLQLPASFKHPTT